MTTDPKQFSATDFQGDRLIVNAYPQSGDVFVNVRRADDTISTVLLQPADAAQLYDFLQDVVEPRQAPEPKPAPRQITGARLYDATGGMILFELQGDNITVDTTKPVSLPLSALVDAVQALSGE